MTLVKLTSIDAQLEDLTAVRSGNSRKWKVATTVLAFICFALITTIIFMSYHQKQLSDRNDELLTITTPIYFNTRKSTITNSILQEITVTTPIRTTATTITEITNPVIFTANAISDFYLYESSFGLSLGHTLCCNLLQVNPIEGFVISVSVRLFTEWEGDHPLYIFIMSSYYFDHQLKQRYPLIPKRNTTDWQTFDIPVGECPISSDNRLAIGMQDSSKINQIYGVRSDLAICGANITGNSTTLSTMKAAFGFYGVAFTYTVVGNRGK